MSSNMRTLHLGRDSRPKTVSRSRCSLGSVPLHRTSQAVGERLSTGSRPPRRGRSQTARRGSRPEAEWNAMTMRQVPAGASRLQQHVGYVALKLPIKQ
ncbi:MAG: hypothetical protein LBQ54_09695 [Planctomycetaceae bacterium]|nr:hypothetical protein [Planctomycetaceae bacterium]